MSRILTLALPEPLGVLDAGQVQSLQTPPEGTRVQLPSSPLPGGSDPGALSAASLCPVPLPPLDQLLPIIPSWLGHLFLQEAPPHLYSLTWLF